MKAGKRKLTQRVKINRMVNLQVTQTDQHHRRGLGVGQKRAEESQPHSSAPGFLTVSVTNQLREVTNTLHDPNLDNMSPPSGRKTPSPDASHLRNWRSRPSSPPLPCRCPPLRSRSPPPCHCPCPSTRARWWWGCRACCCCWGAALSCGRLGALGASLSARQ